MKDRIARTEQGLIRGVPGRDDDVSVFKGVPYAQAPFGNLRWREPQPAIAWSGIKDTDRFGALPVQIKGFFAAGKFEEIYQSEDCLHLNIWTTAKTGDEKMAVFVWFHGGAFQGGYNSDPGFNGERLAEKGIVVVTVSYRLGLMGFLCHPEMRNESKYGTSGNFGVMDQIASLRWIKNNISSFGGDPEKVTIAGQSAGSMSVCNMMCTPYAKGTFRGAICQSGDGIMRFNVESIEDAEKRGLIIAEKLGDGSISSLRAIPFSEFVQPDYDASVAMTGKTCSPVVDGVIIPKAQSDMLLTSEGNPVPMIMGSNRDEGLLPGSDLKAYHSILHSYGNYSDTIKSAYPASDDESAKKALSLIGPEQWFARVSRWATFREEKLSMPTWHYQFCHPSSFRGKKVGAIHSCEIPYIFDSLYDFRKILPIDVLDGDSVIASTMSTYWANFIKYLNPNGDGVPEWPNKGITPHEHMRIDAVTGMESDQYNERMQYQLKSMDRIFGE